MTMRHPRDNSPSGTNDNPDALNQPKVHKILQRIRQPERVSWSFRPRAMVLISYSSVRGESAGAAQTMPPALHPVPMALMGRRNPYTTCRSNSLRYQRTRSTPLPRSQRRTVGITPGPKTEGLNAARVPRGQNHIEASLCQKLRVARQLWSTIWA